MYTITVRYLAQAGEPRGVYCSKDYEIESGLLTVAIDKGHDIVIPLAQVATVDVVREGEEG